MSITIVHCVIIYLGDRAFPVAAARAWNALPLSVKQANTLLTFRRRLKSALFIVSFAD